jgi:hypothetical protein
LTASLSAQLTPTPLFHTGTEMTSNLGGTSPIFSHIKAKSNLGITQNQVKELHHKLDHKMVFCQDADYRRT